MKRWRDRFPGRRFVSVGGVDLHYERAGKGPAVLLVHGLGDSHATWRACVPLLAKKGFDAIALDLKGCGYSEKPDRSDYSTGALVEEIRGFLDALKVKKAVICGVSYGGHLALRFAKLHPERTLALVVCDALAYTRPMRTPIELSLVRLPGLRRVAHWFVSHGGLMRSARKWNFSAAYDGLAERVREHWRYVSMPGGRRAFIALIHGIDKRLVRAAEKDHGAIRAPTLLLWGDADAWFPIAQGERLQKAIRGSKLMIVKGGSHLFMEETPNAFVSRAAPFLTRALAARAPAKSGPRRPRRPGAAPRSRRASRGLAGTGTLS